MWDKLKEQFNLLKIEKRKLCLITNSDKFESKDMFIDAIASAIQGGVDVVQLNELNLPDNTVVEIGHKLRIICDEFGTTFIVNKRIDIAQIVDADGVHLEEFDIDIKDAREILGSNKIIGKSAFCKEDALNSFKKGADYITLGPICTMNNKIEPIPYDDIQWINKNIKIPIFGTGEFCYENIDMAKKSGITRLAMTNPIMYSKIPEQTARSIIGLL